MPETSLLFNVEKQRCSGSEKAQTQHPGCLRHPRLRGSRGQEQDVARPGRPDATAQTLLLQPSAADRVLPGGDIVLTRLPV